MTELKELLQLIKGEEELLSLHNPGLRSLTPSIVEDVYKFIASLPELAQMLADEETQTKHRTALAYYLDSLTSGCYDGSYIEQRRHIGDVHFRLGVKPNWYMAAYRKLFSSFAAHLRTYTRDNQHLYRQILEAVFKVAFFDMLLALDNYMDASARALESKKRLSESALRIFANTSSVAGEEFFETLAHSMMAELDMHHVYIIGLPDGLAGAARILGASAADTLPLPPLREWTPIEKCVAEGLNVSLQSHNLPTLYPASEWLREAGIETVGTSLLHNSNGALTGVIVVADDHPPEDEHRITTLLSLFSARASMEIERIQFDRLLNYQATHDALTGLPNRMLLSDRLSQELLVAERRRLSVAVLFIDLDDFKDVNDCHGHDTGDQLLVHIASVLRETVREEDTIARYGGDEFVIVLGRLDNAGDAELVAQKLIAAIEKPVDINGQRFHGKASIGIATYPDDGSDTHTLLRKADIALYVTKENPNLQYQFFTAGMNATLVRRVALEDQLRHACERGELVLHYQPQVDMVTRHIVGVEALLRWQHPHRGAIPPTEFIPVAEASGLIVGIGDWVIDRACQDMQAWRREGHDGLRLAVNISPRQFESNAILDTIIARLDSHEIPHELFEVELTESLLIANPAATKKLLHAFNERGIMITMDDFGTGYSSLSYLKQYPIHRLKIDRSFISDIADNPNDAAIVQAIIAMAKALDIEVIAEGIETQVQCHRLLRWGCLEAQGFYFARPVTAETIGRILRDEADEKEHAQKLSSFTSATAAALGT